MDISTILPLLMSNNGGDNNKVATILSAMNGGNSSGGNSSGGNSGGIDPSVIMSMMNKGGGATNNAKTNGENKDAPSDDPLLNILKNRTGGGSAMDMVNLMSALGKNKNNKPQAQGFKPVKHFVPNDIMGVMAKLLG